MFSRSTRTFVLPQLTRAAMATAFVSAMQISAAPFTSDGSAATQSFIDPNAWSTPGGPPQVGSGVDDATILAGDTLTYTNNNPTGGPSPSDFTVAGGSTVTILSGGTLQKLSGGNWTRIGDTNGAGTVIVNGTFQHGGDTILAIGPVTGATGTINVDGAGALLATDAGGNNKEIIVGRQGTGTLNVTGGGRVLSASDDFRVGQLGGSIGTVTIDATSSLDHTASGRWIQIGQDGTGTLDSAGIVNTQAQVNLGTNATGNGTYINSGIHNQNNQNFVVGRGGTGAYTLSGQHNQLAGNFIVGEQAAGVGTVIVDGGTLDVANPVNQREIIVGLSGTGTMDIINNGTVNSIDDDFRVGQNAGSSGIVNINSGGTLNHTPTNNRWFQFGNAGTAEINVGLQGTLNSTATVQMGNGATGDGTLNITGGVVNHSATTNVGNNGTGEIFINLGTLDATEINVSNAVGSSGLIDQDGGTITHTGTMRVGRNDLGTYNHSGGTLNSQATLEIGSTGTGIGVMNADGTAVINRTAGDTVVGWNGNGTYNLSDSAVHTQTVADFRIGRNASGVGLVDVSGDAEILHQTNNWFWVGQDGAGTLNVSEDGSVISNAPGRIANGANSSGLVNVSDNGVLQFEADSGNAGDGNHGVNVASDATAVAVINVSDNGLFQVGDGVSTNVDLNLNAGRADVFLSGGTVLVEDDINLSSGSNVNTFSVIDSALTIGGDIQDRGAQTLFGIDGSSVVSADNILFNDAADTPGDDLFSVTGSLQSVTVANDIVVNNNDIFEFILDGTTAAFNPLSVGNNLDLAGAVGRFDVSAWGNGYVPFGTEIPLVDIGVGGSNGSAGIFENFGELQIVGSSGQTNFRLSRFGGDGNDLVLLAVPEPSRAILLSLGLGALFLRRRR